MRATALLALLAWLPLSAGAADTPRRPGAVFRHCPACPEMVVVPAGMFVMGTPTGAAGEVAGAEAQPVVMAIPRAFALGRHEVTRREYARFIAASGYEPRPGCRNWDPALVRFNEDARRGWQDPTTPVSPQDDHPVSCVSWDDAQAYVTWLARQTGEPYRLPSEAEWEYAARGGTTTLRPWGDAAADGCDHANTYDLNSDAAYRLGWMHAGCRDGYADLAPVGQFQPNAFGLLDMIGNVAEWVEDCATDSYVGRPRDARAWTWLGGCRERIQRGGSWLGPPERNRSAWRRAAESGERAGNVGLRVALDVEVR